MYIKLNQTAIFKSKKGKIYELTNINGNLKCYAMPNHEKRKPTKEILKVVSLEKSESEYIVYTDGGCDVNPGGRGGIGVVIINKSSGEIKELSEGYLSTTNNRMEITAIIKALELIPKNSKVYLYSDSQYALNCMNGIWEKKKNTDLWEQIDKLAADKKIITKWVRGHNGNPNNERCDELATKGIMNAKMIDAGYKGKPASRPSSKTIDIKSENVSLEDSLSSKEYAEKYKIKETCAINIKEFQKSNKSFKNFLKLKTGGIDYWSNKKKADFVELFGTETVEKANEYFEFDKDLESCLRWHARGLSLKDSIRKSLIDIEVRNNARKAF